MTDRAADDRRTACMLPLFLVGQIAGILLGRTALSPWPAVAALALSLGALLLLRRTARLAALLLFACALGAVTSWQSYHSARPAEGTYQVRGIIIDELTQGNRGQVKTRLCAVTLDGTPVATDAYWSFYPGEVPEDLVPGCGVTFIGRVYDPMVADNPDGFSFHEHLLSQHITCAVYGWEELTCAPAETFSLRGCMAAFRHRLLEKFSAVMGQEAADYAAAMLLGVKQRIPQDDQDAFSRLGAAHVLVVSGFHVSVLAGLMAWLLRGCSLSLRTCITTLVLLAYTLLVGGHAPVARALLLYLLSAFARLLNRPRPLLWTLCTAASLTLLFVPAQLFSASFQLTYAAMLGIAIVTPQLRRLGQAAAYSLGAQAGVLLPVLYYFHELPLWGLVLNFLLLPAASALILLYWSVLAALPFPPLAEALGALAGQATRLMTATLHQLNALPVVSLWTSQANGLTLLAWLTMLLLLSPFVRLKPRRRMLPLLCTLVMLLSVIPLPHGTTEYIQFAEGSADAALLWDKDCAVVVDVGEDGRTLSTYLHQQRQDIDTLIITHLHDDHALGVQALLDDRIPIGEVCLPWGAEQTAASPEALALLETLRALGIPARYLARGDKLSLPSGEITVLWPEAGKVRPGADPNVACLVLLAQAEGVSLLLTGDIDGSRAHYVATPADVLKAPHHGAQHDNRADFLAAVHPKAVLVSCGRTNDLTDLRARVANAALYDTYTHGALVLHLQDGAFTIDAIKE